MVTKHLLLMTKRTKGFLLLSLFLFLSGMNLMAQNYKSLIVNGNFEGTDFSSFVYSNAYGFQEVTDESLSTSGTNHYLVVTSKENASNYWDSQLFIKLDRALVTGDKIKFSIRIKANRQTKVTTQAHAEPGTGIHWAMVGNIQVTTEWKEYTNEVTVASEQNGCQTIVLDLNQDKDGGIEFCFDDISVMVLDSSDPAEEENTAYITNGNFEGSDFSSFVYFDGNNFIGVTNDYISTSDNNRYLVVTSKKNASNYWDSQLFIKLGKPLATGDNIKFSIRVKASRQTKITTQAQSTPGTGIHWAMVGDIPVTTEWKVYTYEGTVIDKQNGCQTIALDLNQDKNGGIEFCFDDISVKINDDSEPEDENYVSYIVNGDLEGSNFSSFAYNSAAVEDYMVAITAKDIVADDTNGHCLKITSLDGAENPWDTQLYIKLNKPLHEGDQVRFSMRAKASEDVTVSTESHTTPHTYCSWSFLPLNALTTKWAVYKYVRIINSSEEGMQTIAISLNEEPTSIDYYFDDISVMVLESTNNPDPGNNPVNPEPQDQSNYMAASNVTAAPGSQIQLPINLTNEDVVKLCQFDLRLPEGVTVAMKSNGKLDASLTERAESHSVSSKQLTNGDYRFVLSSMESEPFTGKSGALLEIKLEVPATMATGEYVLKMFNVELSVSDGNDLKVVKPADTESKLTVGSYKLGDVNNDGSVSVTDVGCTINYILEQPPSVFIFDAADMNGDKVISVTDVGMIINVILNDGAASRQKEQRIVADAHLSLIPATDGYQLLLEDKDAFVGFQFDLQLADGTINDMRLNDDDHLLTYRKLGDGKYRVVCYSLTNSTFDGNGVALLNIATTGDMTISNIRLTTVGLSEVGFDDINATPTGIADASGLIHQTSELKIYSLDGRLCRIIRVQPGENPLNGLKAGIYLIGNRKVIVK